MNIKFVRLSAIIAFLTVSSAIAAANANRFFPAAVFDIASPIDNSFDENQNENFFMPLPGKPRINHSDQNFSPLVSSGKIAFVSNRTGNQEIFTMNADGSNPINVSNNAAEDDHPAWSPDGSKIVFTSLRNNNYDVYVMNADGSNQTRLTTNVAPDGTPSWSPDGAKIVFYSSRGNNGDIYLMNANGTNQIRLTTDEDFESSPKFSPDGTRIVFESQRDGNFEIYVMNTDGSNQTRLTNNFSIDRRASFSPDGSKIFFYSFRTGGGDIYVMDADGNNPINLSNNPAFDTCPEWSPDGSRIAFDTERDGNREIYAMNADGTNQTRLTSDAAADFCPAWQPVASSYSINGTVQEPNSQPIANLTVSLTGTGITGSSTATTDASGFYSFLTPAAGGDYTVSLPPSVVTVSPQTVTNLQSNQTVNFTGSRVGQPISGKVTGSCAPQPQQFFTVKLQNLDTGQMTNVNTIIGGNYTFGFQPAGFNYRVMPMPSSCAITPLDRQFYLNSPQMNVDFTASLPSITVSGNVRADDANLAGAIVRLAGSSAAATTTDANGNYSFPNLAAGASYTVSVYKSGYNFNPTYQTLTSVLTNQTVNFQNGTPLCAPPPPTGLVGWYRSEDDFNDSSGFDNTGAPQQGASFATGKVGRSFSFDGADDYVSIPDSVANSATGQLTLAAWVKSDVIPNGAITFVSKYESQNNQISYLFGTQGANGRLRFSVYENSINSLTAETDGDVLTAEAFTHVAATFNPTTQEIKIYVNGASVPVTQTQIGDEVTSIFDSDTSVRIGAHIGDAGDATDLFDGSIDETQIYNRALSASEVAAIYDAGSAGVCADAVLITTGNFLYIFEDYNQGNKIYGYSVDETTGQFTALKGFPVATGGNGVCFFEIGTGGCAFGNRMTLDALNNRLYVINRSSNTVSAYSINASTGSLSALPFSPIELGNGVWDIVDIHPSGSPLIVGNNSNKTVAAYNITATTATAAGGGLSTGVSHLGSNKFSRDGNYFYVGGFGSTFAGFTVNSINGVLTPLAGSPFDSGSDSFRAIAADSQGRLFGATGFAPQQIRAFTSLNGIPSSVTGNPFATELAATRNGTLHPNQNFYAVTGNNNNGNLAIGIFQISGTGAATTLTSAPGSPLISDYSGALIFNRAGNFLYTLSIDHAITTYNFNSSNGVLTFNNLFVNPQKNGGWTINMNYISRAETPTEISLGNGVGIIFPDSTQPGYTVATPIANASAGVLPNGYSLIAPSVAYDIRTSASYTGNITVAFAVPNVPNAQTCDTLRMFHYETTNNPLSNITTGTNVYNSATQVCTVTGQTTSLSPFVIAQFITPTAANVTVGGRVSTADGDGIRNALVTLTDANGNSRTTLTGKFGAYRFADVAAGQNYIITVRARRLTFSANTQIRMISEDTNDINFTADEANVIQRVSP